MNGLPTVRARKARRSRPQLFGTGLESLERRELLATFVVTNSGDLTNTGAVVPGSLRAAIENSNITPGNNRIIFNIGGSGVHTIVISPIPQPNPPGPLPLPAIINPVTIDGTTQPGFGGQPLIEINGLSAGNSANGLRIDASDTVIKAITINRFSQAGIRIEASSVTVQGSFIGTNNNGSLPLGNGGPGILIDDQANCLIGGTTPGAINLISGNLGGGIQILNGSTNDQVVGNVIGTDITGGKAIPNSGNGVLINGSSFNVIGGGTLNDTQGNTVSQGNVISGNTSNGVLITGLSSTGNSIQGNTIGLNQQGNKLVPNQGFGVSILGAQRNLIGGLNTGTGDFISGNLLGGVQLGAALGTVIQGNTIGTDSTTALNLANGGPGITINRADNSTIGGNQAGAKNTIWFNGGNAGVDGIQIITGLGIPILNNSIFANQGLGIDIQDPALLAATPAPKLTSAVTGAGRTLIQGSFAAAPNATYTIQFFSNTTADPSGFGQGKTFIGQTLITTDANGLGTIHLILPTPTTVGQFIAATSTNSQNETSNFSNDVPITVANIANLGLQVSASPSPATLGGNLVYTITINNSGPSDATNVTLNDTFPISANFVSATVSQGTFIQNVGSITADLGTVPAGGSATVTLTVLTTATGTVTNLAVVSSNEIDPDTTNNSVSTSTQVVIPSNVSLSITDPRATPGDPTSPPAVLDVESQFAYIIVATNTGPGQATNVVVTDTLPAGVTVISASSGQGTSTVVGNTVITTLGSLPNGVSAAVRIVAVASVVGSLTDTATVTHTEVDPNPPSNTATITNTVRAVADLNLGLRASPEPVLVGQNLTYTVTVTNSGPSNATGVSLTDLLPADVNYVSAVSSQGSVSQANGSVVANLGEIDFGNTATVTIVVVPTKSETITNTATLTANEFDPNPGDNTASVNSTVSPAEVGVTIQAIPSPVLAGDNLSYTLLVTNNGPATADGPNGTGVQLVDTLPSGVTYVSASAAQGTVQQFGNTVSFDLGSIAAGTTIAATIVVIPNAPGSLTNSATVSAQEFDPNPSNNSASITTLVSPVDLVVSTVATPASVLFGGNLTYSIILTNGGPATATNVTLTDTLPAGAIFVSGTSSQGQVLQVGGTVIVPVGILSPNASVAINIVVTPTTLGTATNTVQATSDEMNASPLNGLSITSTTVFNLPGQFDLSAPAYTFNQNAGVVQITINRLAGSQGAASVTLTASGGNARPGVDYAPFSQVVNFADGQLSQTVALPLLDDGQHGPDRALLLTLSNPTNNIPIGPFSSAVVTIVNVHPDLIGPVVTNAQLLGSGSITGILLSFSKTLDTNSAINLNNYIVSASNGARIALRTVQYDPVSGTVLLTLPRPLSPNSFYSLRINAATPGDLTDNTPARNPLDGADNGVNGTDYFVTFIRASTIKYIDASGNLVTLKLTGGGTLDLIRSASGQGAFLRIVNPRPYRSTLSGTVKPSSHGGTGSTTLRVIDGFLPFGQTRSTLTQPPFFVANQPLNAGAPPVSVTPSAIVSPAALDALLAGAHHFTAPKAKRHRHK
jgi:uncharacterized repeat protein (TIGR01451 family)